MSDKTPIKVVLCWHMHQPYYRHATTGRYVLPWTYLHAIKDYIDMAALIEADPKARAVVNFAPILLQQIDDYAQQTRRFLTDGTAVSDPLLNALVAPVSSIELSGRTRLLRDCLKANEQRLIKRFPIFDRLAGVARTFGEREDAIRYLSDQFIIDLVMWYHLAWMGETVRRENAVVKGLIEKGEDFSMDDRMALMRVISQVLEEIIPTYRRIAENGQVELAFSPYAHPIIPLLLDFESARDAMPHVTLPNTARYPGGEERAMWHLHRGMQVFESYFGFKPHGCWPSEGGVSAGTLKVCEEYGVKWVASGESVMRNSLGQSPKLHQKLVGHCLHHAYKLDDHKTFCFFRDDGLSDLIGFSYSTWHADDAVANLLHHLENIADACPDKKNTIVPIIMDGENAWEHYPENGYHFLSSLYKQLSSHPKLELTTFSDFLAAAPEATELDKLVSGSWVYGTFSTWIGDKDKNRAWDLLCDAKHAFDRAVASKKLQAEQLDQAIDQLAICEGSDWFWWFGDYNPADSVSDFEQLYRIHLKELYRIIGEPAPAALDHPLSTGGGAPEGGGVMRRGKD